MMNNNPELLKDQLEEYEEELKGIKSYVKELNDMTARHGTDSEVVKDDLFEAESNSNYYEAEITRIKRELGQSGIAPKVQAAAKAVMPQTAKQGVGSLLFSSIGFLAGLLLGTRLQRSHDRKRER
ncbi:MAG: hypothetical protein ICV60_23225 [Pyrinomonadaceae bacterium]|nr:hypothetical protein [Pyrinomonadaceae bacterium]